MKKLLGLSLFWLLCGVTMGMIWFSKARCEHLALFPVLLIAFFTLENLLKKKLQGKRYLHAQDRIYDRKCDLPLLPVSNGLNYHNGVT